MYLFYSNKTTGQTWEGKAKCDVLSGNMSYQSELYVTQIQKLRWIYRVIVGKDKKCNGETTKVAEVSKQTQKR